MENHHPTQIIETADGNIVMSKPSVKRSSALSNSIYSIILTDDELLKCNKMETDKERNEFIQVKSLKKGFTTFQLTLLSYVESAPWHMNDYSVEPILDLKSFLDYVDDKPEIMAKMKGAIEVLGKIDPLSP